ncbi:MAG: thioredoxin [Candidatus Altiarchaeales archaeon]|nr:thioredoxin [Candidatus Altiarchaeales archaeon]
MKVLTDATFDKEVSENKLVLVDFWAEWCAPCRMLAPVLEEVSGEYDSKVAFAKLDISQNKGTAGKFKITAIPTIILFKGGKQVNSIIGAVSKEKIKGMINEHLV